MNLSISDQTLEKWKPYSQLFLRLALGQTGFERSGMNEPPVRVEKLAPTFLIAPVFEPGEQALACRD